MDSPQNHIWGPRLWLILHSAAERIGVNHLKRLPQEESRIWSNLLSSLRYSLPCPQCKKHYTSYYGSYPLSTFNREFIRNWLYVLHCHVNDRTEKQNTVSIDKIPEIYGQPFNFSEQFGIVSKEMVKALRMGWSSREDIQRSVRCFEELKRFYDFF
jgi:hypothetical protein